MRYIIVLFFLLLLGCSPKYKSVSEHLLPPTIEGKECVSKCQEEYSSCKKICEANFDICKDRALKVAKERYDQKMQEYVALLEEYSYRLRAYDFERSFFYFDGFWGYGYSRFYYPRYMFWIDYPILTIPRPVKPKLSIEIKRAQKELCDLDCGCSKSYDKCFIECGGTVKESEVCIKNCPDDKK